MTMTTANVAFHMNTNDVHSLLDFHEKKTGTGRGRRWDVEVLNKSAIVLLCAAWEAYCEDVVTVVVEHYVDHAPNAMCLPTPLRKRISKPYNDGNRHMEAWNLADDGWRKVLRDRLDDLQEERDRHLNTPKSGPLKEMFRDNVGCEDITDHWSWNSTNKEKSCKTLNEFVELRGAIAHRANAPEYVLKREVLLALGHVQRLVKATDAAMFELALEVTGMPLPDDSPDGRASATAAKVEAKPEDEAIEIGPM